MVSDTEVISFIQKQPDGVGQYACQVFVEGFEKVGKIEKLKENGSDAEKALAAKQLAEMGIPKVWFQEGIERRYPGYSDEDLMMLFSYAARATR